MSISTDGEVRGGWRVWDEETLRKYLLNLAVKEMEQKKSNPRPISFTMLTEQELVTISIWWPPNLVLAARSKSARNPGTNEVAAMY